MKPLLSGHFIGGIFKPFLHVCPGDHCAVAFWLWWIENKKRHHLTLRPRQMPTGESAGDREFIAGQEGESVLR